MQQSTWASNPGLRVCYWHPPWCGHEQCSAPRVFVGPCQKRVYVACGRGGPCLQSSSSKPCAGRVLLQRRRPAPDAGTVLPLRTFRRQPRPVFPEMGGGKRASRGAKAKFTHPLPSPSASAGWSALIAQADLCIFRQDESCGGEDLVSPVGAKRDCPVSGCGGQSRFSLWSFGQDGTADPAVSCPT